MKFTYKNKDDKDVEILSFEQNTDLVLLHMPYKNSAPYIVAYGFNIESKSWQQGHYFMSLDSAQSYMYNRVKEYYTENELDQESYRTLIDINKVDLLRQNSNELNTLLQRYTDIEGEYLEECLVFNNSEGQKILFPDIEELPFSNNGYDRCLGGEGSYILRNADDGKVFHVTNIPSEKDNLLKRLEAIAYNINQRIKTIEGLTAEKLNINDYGRIMQFMNERAEKDENWTWFLDEDDILYEEFSDDDIMQFFIDVEDLKTYRPDIDEIIEFADGIEEFKHNKPCATFYGSFLEIFHDENELESMGYFDFLEQEEQEELE